MSEIVQSNLATPRVSIVTMTTSIEQNRYALAYVTEPKVAVGYEYAVELQFASNDRSPTHRCQQMDKIENVEKLKIFRVLLPRKYCKSSIV